MMGAIEIFGNFFQYGHNLLPSIVWLWFVCLGCFALLTLISFTTQTLTFRNHVESTSTSNSGADVVIIGSGILGSALAATLARDGRHVTVIERDLKEPDRIVGELLQPGGRRALKELGLEHCTEKVDAHTIKGYILHDRENNQEVAVGYPEEDHKKINWGRAFHHGRFVMSLRSAAQEENNVTYIEGTAIKLIEENGIITGVKYREKETSQVKDIFASLTVVADGCFSKFRKHLVAEVPTVKSHFVAMVMQNCPQARSNHAEIILAACGPVLIYQISSTCTRVLVDIKGCIPKDVKEYLKHNIYPQLPEHIQDAFLDAVETGRIRSMPNSFLPPAAVEKPGVLVLGDAFNMRHPLTGGGMSVALNDVVIWRQLLRKIPDLKDYSAMSKALKQFHLRRKRAHSFVVNLLAQALYELFASGDVHLKCMKSACIRYFKLGGECVTGPVGLLSITSPKPQILVGHFFAVALFAIYVTFASEKLRTLHRTTWKAVCIFWKSCAIMLPLIWTEIKPIFF